MDISGKISQANGRLNAAGISISIQQLGDRLYLRGKFPPKPTGSKTHPHQQRAREIDLQLIAFLLIGNLFESYFTTAVMMVVIIMVAVANSPKAKFTTHWDAIW